MNREELRWILQTIKEPAKAERFVLAQYERGRISFELMAGTARKRGWVNRAANPFATALARYANEYQATVIPIAIVRQERRHV